MSNKTTDYINPYKPVATLYKNGLDYIISCMTASSSSSSCDCDCSDVTVEKLINCVCAYLFSIKGIDASDPDNLLYVTNIRVTVTNAVNGYLDNGSAAIGTLRGLESVPVKDISAYFDRLDQSIGDSSMLKTSKSNQQLVLSIGRASFEYWNSKVGGSAASPWNVYLDGNKAIDTASIPYWVSAAMFGSQFNFWQDNASDTEAVTTALYTALGGALVVGAGKVIFGWVPKDTVQFNIPLSLDKQVVTSLMNNKGDWDEKDMARSKWLLGLLGARHCLRRQVYSRFHVGQDNTRPNDGVCDPGNAD